MIKLLLILIIFSIPTSLMAAFPKPPELVGLINSNQPFGATKLTKIFWGDIYDISLWTDEDVWSPGQPYAISIDYLMSFTTDQLVDKTIEQMRNLGAPFDPENYRKVLESLFPNVNKGDRITASFKPGRGVTFFFNGAKRGTVSNNNFSKYFSDIWLSPATEEPEMRDGLLRKE